TMRRSSVQRAIGALVAVLIAVLVGVVLGASPASAHPGNAHDHGTSARQHDASEHSHKAAKAKSDKHPLAASKASAKRQDAGLGGLDGLLDSIINGTLPTVVKKTDQAVTSTVTTTTNVVTTTTDVVTTVLGGTKTSTAPTPTATPTPASTAPKPPQPSTAAAHPGPVSSPTKLGIASTAGSASATQHVQVAPLQGPNLIAATTTATHQPTAAPTPRRQVDAITPASLLTAPGTGLLIGVVLIFGLGV